MNGPAVASPPQRTGRHRLVGYLVVGVLSYAIDVGILVTLRDLAGAPLLVATTVGFWSSVLFNFLANRWVFQADQGGATAHAARYALLLVVNYGLTVLIVQGGVALGADAVLAKTVAVGLIACSNFVAYKRWVFA